MVRELEGRRRPRPGGEYYCGCGGLGLVVGTANVCSQAEGEEEPPAGCIGHTYLIILRVSGMQLMLTVQLHFPHHGARPSVCSGNSEGASVPH